LSNFYEDKKDEEANKLFEGGTVGAGADGGKSDEACTTALDDLCGGIVM